MPTQPQVPIEQIEQEVEKLLALPNGVWQLNSYKMLFINLRSLLKRLGFDEYVFCIVSQQVYKAGNACVGFYVNYERRLAFAGKWGNKELKESLVAILKAMTETEVKPYDPTKHFWA